MAKIFILRSAAGPHGVFRKGGTYEVAEELARSFERVGICEVIAATPTRQAAPTTTKETKPAPRTTKKRGRPKNRS